MSDSGFEVPFIMTQHASDMLQYFQGLFFCSSKMNDVENGTYGLGVF
jgi:hypothetical protein